MNDVQSILKQEDMYFANATLVGIATEIGYEKLFRWQWIATQLNTFVFVGTTSQKIDRSLLEAFSTSCYNYGLKNHKGWPRGLQSGTASIAILAGEDIDESAIQFAKTASIKHWSAFEVPVLYNITLKKAYYYTSKPIWGRIYFSYLDGLLQKIVSQLK